MRNTKKHIIRFPRKNFYYSRNLDTSKFINNFPALFGFELVLFGIVGLTKAKQLDNAVFEEDIKQTLSSPLIVSPLITPKYSGIMVAKRF